MNLTSAGPYPHLTYSSSIYQVLHTPDIDSQRVLKLPYLNPKGGRAGGFFFQLADLRKDIKPLAHPLCARTPTIQPLSALHKPQISSVQSDVLLFAMFRLVRR